MHGWTLKALALSLLSLLCNFIGKLCAECLCLSRELYLIPTVDRLHPSRQHSAGLCGNVRRVCVQLNRLRQRFVCA